MKKLILISGMVLLVTGVWMLTSSAARNDHQPPYTPAGIQVVSKSGNPFISVEDIKNLIARNVDATGDNQGAPAPLQAYQEIVDNNAFVDQAHVYRSINGEIRIDATLRDPLMRIINRQNESYYIDVKGYMFPLSDRHTARVMLVTGAINTSYSPGTTVRREKEQEMGVLSGLYALASHIHNDPFWKAFIDHIVVLPTGKFELIPKNGAHIIEFGHADRIEEKFRNLRVFYQRGLTQIGWNHYGRVNVEFRHQVVCSQ